MKLIPEKLIEARGLAGLTQDQLAVASGVSRASINGYELGHSFPRKTTLYRLARALNVDVAFLTTLKEESQVGKAGTPALADFINDNPELRQILIIELQASQALREDRLARTERLKSAIDSYLLSLSSKP